MKGTVILIAAGAVVLLGLITLVPRADKSSPHPDASVATDSPAPMQEVRSRRRAVDARALAEFEVQTNSQPKTNLYARLVNGDIQHVSREQVEAFLTQRGRTVESLLGALRATGDEELLKEAKEKFPNDPRVQFAAAFKSESGAERQEWLEKFKESAPDNSMASYLLAGEKLKAGQTVQALEEFAAAGGKADFQNYIHDFVQNTEEAYQAAGYSSAEAKALAASGALLPELSALKQASLDLMDLAKRYQEAGQDASVRALQEMALSLGRRLDQPNAPQMSLIEGLVGMAIERRVLTGMDPNAAYGSPGQTVQNRLDALKAQKEEGRNLVAVTEPILNAMSDQDLAYYYDRRKVYGEMSALKWVASLPPPPEQQPK